MNKNKELTHLIEQFLNAQVAEFDAAKNTILAYKHDIEHYTNWLAKQITHEKMFAQNNENKKLFCKILTLLKINILTMLFSEQFVSYFIRVSFYF